MKTDYEKQAEDFLKKCNTEISIVFLKHDKYFSDDKDTRDIYEITLKRGERKYTFTFGQSLNKSGIKIVNQNTSKTMRTFAPSKRFEKNGKFNLMLFKYGCGWQFASCDIVVQPKAPTAYDILACLTKHNPGTFEDFCSEFGYDTDSRRAEKTYNAVKDEYLNLCALFNGNEMEELAEIQ
jgi:hypothetical protein